MVGPDVEFDDVVVVVVCCCVLLLLCFVVVVVLYIIHSVVYLVTHLSTRTFLSFASVPCFFLSCFFLSSLHSFPPVHFVFCFVCLFFVLFFLTDSFHTCHLLFN